MRVSLVDCRLFVTCPDLEGGELVDQHPGDGVSRGLIRWVEIRVATDVYAEVVDGWQAGMGRQVTVV